MCILKALCDSAKPWQYGYQDPATPIIRGIIHLHNNIIFYLIIILCLVCWLLFRAIFKFRTEKNKFPYKYFAHPTSLESGWIITLFFSLVLFAIYNGIIFGGPTACCESGGIPADKSTETTSISDSSSTADTTTQNDIGTTNTKRKKPLSSQSMKDFFLYAETISLIEELKSLISLIESGQHTKEDIQRVAEILKRLKYLNVLQPETLKSLQDSLELIEGIEETKKVDN